MKLPLYAPPGDGASPPPQSGRGQLRRARLASERAPRTMAMRRAACLFLSRFMGHYCIEGGGSCDANMLQTFGTGRK